MLSTYLHLYEKLMYKQRLGLHQISIVDDTKQLTHLATPLAAGLVYIARYFVRRYTTERLGAHSSRLTE